MDPKTKTLIALLVILIIWIGWKMKNTEIAARVAYGEARGEGDKGMQAVLNVMANRQADGRYPSTLGGVATQTKQFSAYNDNDPNRDVLDAVTKNDPIFQTALALAELAATGHLPDITGGATHYHADWINPPYWTAGATETTRIGSHIFYKGVA